MKKLILIVCAVMNAMAMNAQNKFGVMGGNGDWVALLVGCMTYV